MPWPAPGNPGGFVQFDRPDEWRLAIGGLKLNPLIPDIVQGKYARAQKLYLLGWIDVDVIKAGELAALIALELALMDRYGGQLSKSKRTFANLLKHMVTADGLTDAQIPMIARYGGTAVGQVTGDVRPSLADRRNGMAHGDPFDGLPVGGLLELVRDLIEHAYRRYIAEGVAAGLAGPRS